MINDARSNHKTRIQSATSDTAQRMPCSVIKPIPKLVESVGHEVFGCTEVEPGVNYQELAGRQEGHTSEFTATDIRG